jgi:hypothetical protein
MLDYLMDGGAGITLTTSILQGHDSGENLIEIATQMPSPR